MRCQSEILIRFSLLLNRIPRYEWTTVCLSRGGEVGRLGSGFSDRLLALLILASVKKN